MDRLISKHKSNQGFSNEWPEYVVLRRDCPKWVVWSTWTNVKEYQKKATKNSSHYQIGETTLNDFVQVWSN